MANGFPAGSFRIINKATGTCIASQYFEQTDNVQNEVIAPSETRFLPFSYTNDRLLTVHDKVKNIRTCWVLIASVSAEATDKLLDKDLETFLELLPTLDEETQTHLRSSNCLDIVRLLQIFIDINGKETIKSEYIDKFGDDKLNNSINIALAYKSLPRIEREFFKCKYKLQEYTSFPFYTLDAAELAIIKQEYELKYKQQGEKLYKILLASIQLDILNTQIYTSSGKAVLKLNLSHHSSEEIKYTETVLEKLKKEKLEEIKLKTQTELKDVEEPRRKAVKIIQELSQVLNLSNNEKNINLVKKILQTSLKSNEAFEQLETALNSTNGKKLQSVNMYNGDVDLQGSGRQYQTKWAFEDGYIFVEDQPNAVLTHSCDSSIYISHRSDNPNQLWELK